MFRPLFSLFRTHRFRLISMSIIFASVVFIIALIEQIIVNIDNQIINQTRPIVWADLTIESNTWFSDTIWNDINTLVNNTQGEALRSIEFFTTLDNAQEPKLAQVKAIESWYPLYGDLIITSVDNTTTRKSQEKNLQDGVWIDQQSYDLIGNNKTIKLGSLELPVLGIITQQASVWFNFLDEGRTIIIPYELVKQTNLTDFWSRVDYEIQIKTNNDEQTINLQKLLENKFGEWVRIRLAKDRIEQLWSITQQLDQYTSILLIITVLLCIMVMTTATTTMTNKIQSSIAVMRVLGLSRLSTWIMTSILFGSLFVRGWIRWNIWAYFLFNTIGNFIPLANDFLRYPWTTWTIIALSWVCFVIACRKVIWQLSMTKPLILLQKQDTTWDKNEWLQYFIFWLWAWIIMSILQGNIVFAAFVVVIAWIVLWLWYHWLIKRCKRLHRSVTKRRTTNFLWFDASRKTILPGNQTWLLIGWLGSALIAFAIVVSLSSSFIDRLDTSAIEQPNLFILNVRNEDIKNIEQFDKTARLYDTILWRIVSINTVPLQKHINTKELRGEEFNREFNITSVALANSPIVQGTPLTAGGVSLDKDFARSLWVSIKDTLTINIQWRIFDLTITSLRKSIRTWAEPFFYIQLDKTQFEQAPRSRFWITRQSDNEIIPFKKSALDTIGNHLSFIDISTVIGLVTDISNKIVTVILVYMSIIITLIVLVSIASNEASAILSQKGYQLYHILGMTKQELTQISRNIGLIYSIIITILLVVFVPWILFLIYNSASILSFSIKSIIPVSIGIIITIWIMVLSYRLFHKAIIKKL